MHKELITGAEILVACEKVSTEAEVTGINKYYKSIEFNPVSCTPSAGYRTGWGLRMVRSGKIGVSGEWGLIDRFRLVEKTISSCRFGPKALFSFPDYSPDYQEHINKSIDSITHDSVNDYLNELQEKIKQIHPLFSLSAGIQWGTDSFVVMNSNGMNARFLKPIISSRFSLTLPGNSGLLQSGYSLSTTTSLPVMEDVLEMILLPMNSVEQNILTASGGKDVVFSPVAFSVLLQAVRAGVSGNLLIEGSSPLAHMEGKQVLSKSLTIRDLPRLSNGASSAPFDSEGIPTSDKTLFENGVFTGFLHDLNSAAQLETESTGSSGRNLGEHSKPVCTNITVDPSIIGSSNTLAETGSGILVTSILSAGGSNAVSGSFTFDCGRVYVFRRGEIQGYYDGCVLSGNVYDALSNISVLGSKQFRVKSDLLPFVSISNISVR